MTKRLKISEYTTGVTELIKRHAESIIDTVEGKDPIEYVITVREDGWYEAVPDHTLVVPQYFNENLFGLYAKFSFKILHVGSAVIMNIKDNDLVIPIEESLENLDNFMIANVNYLKKPSIESARLFLLEIIKYINKFEGKFSITDIVDGFYIITHIDSETTALVNEREKIGHILYKMQDMLKTGKAIKKYNNFKNDDAIKKSTFRNLYDYGIIGVKNKYTFKDGTKMKLTFEEFAGTVYAVCKIGKGKKSISRRFTDVELEKPRGLLATLMSTNPKSEGETVSTLLQPFFINNDADSILHVLLMHYNTNITIDRDDNLYIVNKNNSMTYRSESLLPLAKTVLGFD